MGQIHSKRVIQLQEYKSHASKEHTIDIMLHKQDDLPFSGKSVVLGIDLLFVYNPKDVTNEIILHGLPIDPLIIPIPPKMNQPVEEVVYRHPKLRSSELRKYAGMEEWILAKKDIYQISDPMIQFILENNDFVPVKHSDDGNYVTLSKENEEQIQTFFKNAIFGEIRYTELDMISMENPIDAYIVLRFNYLEILDEKMLPLKPIKSIYF